MKQISLLFLFFTINLVYSQATEYKVFNTSINSKYAELGTTYFKNDMVLFASSKKSDTDKAFKKDRRKNNRQLYLELYLATITNNGDLIQTRKFKKELKSIFFESDVSFTSDFKTVYFTWNNFYSIESRKDKKNWKTLHIVKASINENFEISNIINLPFNSNQYSVRSPKVSYDGKQLFFVSDMPNGFGETDIYVVDILDNEMYGEPKNLGSNINTEEPELLPFIDQNSTLYFSSYGHKGKGNLDIFKSIYKNSNYQKAINLPSPINSEFDDFALVINSEGNAGYLTSNRKDGKGDVDIYAFKIKEKVINCTKVITGIIINKETQESINEAYISLYHNTILQETKIIIKGSKYSFKLKCDENYKIIVKKEGFIDEEFEINITDTHNAEFSKNIELTPLKCNQFITGTILNIENNDSLANARVSLFYNNTLIETKTINKNFNFEVECNKTYKLIADKDGFVKKEIEIKTSKTNNAELSNTLALTPIKCSQLITGTVFDDENNHSLDNFQVSLFQNNILKNKKTIKIGNIFSFELDCKESYTFTVQKDGYTSVETKLNTNNINKVEISKTIRLKPIECKQLFTGVVLDKETNKPLSKAVVSIYTNNNLVNTITLDNNATFSYEIDCKFDYKIVTSLKNYQDAVLLISTSNNPNEIVHKKILLKSNLEFITIREQKMIKTNAIYFDLDQSNIRPDAAVELEKVIRILYKYPSIKIEIKSHTDSRAPDNYNMDLSNKRAESTINYIISKGVDPSRITGKGYGETQIINKCINGVKCTQAEHEINRRTEFIIIED